MADRPLAKPLTGVLSTEFSTNEGGLASEDRRQQRPSRARRAQAFGCCCALCDDTHGLQIHHIVHRSCGGNDTPCNLITLCWRCHAEAHGTWVAERHAVRPPRTAEERYAAYRMLQDEYEQLCVEYVSDYYAERGEEWWPYK